MSEPEAKAEETTEKETTETTDAPVNEEPTGEQAAAEPAEAGDDASGDGDGAAGDNADGEAAPDKYFESMKERFKEMEDEAAKLKDLQAKVEQDLASSSGAADERTSGVEADHRSVYVGQVDYSATPEELQAHFQSCGTIKRITILCDKWTGHPKGFAYVEFAEPEAIANALMLNDSLFKGRQLKVAPKRQNVPKFQRGGMSYRGRGRGRGRGGRGGFGGGFPGYGQGPPAFGGFRGGRGRPYYRPY